MPWLDVSEVLGDPNLSTTFRVIRRIQEVTQQGTPRSVVDAEFEAYGVVVPTANNSLVRQEAYETQNKSIQVITEFRLRGASKNAAQQNFLPDLIQWAGDTYIVQSLSDFLQFGDGFLAAECLMIDYIPTMG